MRLSEFGQTLHLGLAISLLTGVQVQILPAHLYKLFIVWTHHLVAHHILWLTAAIIQTYLLGVRRGSEIDTRCMLKRIHMLLLHPCKHTFVGARLCL